MSRARIVEGALVEGDDEGTDSAGNAGGWIHLELMVEEVRRDGGRGGLCGCVWRTLGGGNAISSASTCENLWSPVGKGVKTV